jgi:hypothetical protein
MQYLREQAKETIKEYATEHLPEQYHVCLHALDEIIKNAWVIMAKSDDNREKLQAMELFKDTHLVKLELLSNATTIDHALQYIKGKQNHSKKWDKMSHFDEEDTEPAATTTTAAEATGKQSVF